MKRKGQSANIRLTMTRIGTMLFRVFVILILRPEKSGVGVELEGGIVCNDEVDEVLESRVSVKDKIQRLTTT